MRYFDYPEHYCDNLSEAVELAIRLQLDSEYDLFRGQRHTFDITPSIARQGVDAEEASEKIQNFATWIHQTPELVSLHHNTNAILAVAQHYGIQTPLLDFSYNPRIAGFFASDNGRINDTGTIICINKNRFIESWHDMNQGLLKDKGYQLTELIEIDVKNLWRLKAQEGMFIKCHVDYGYLEMFSYMLHIYFPQKGEVSGLKREEIYPKQKSHLEVLLEQYFLIDSYPKRETKLKAIFGTPIFKITEDSLRTEIQSFFLNNTIPPEHESWTSRLAQKWLAEPNENFSALDSHDVTLKLPIIKGARELELYAYNSVLDSLDKNCSEIIIWDVISHKNEDLFIDGEGVQIELNEFTEFKLPDMVNVIYSGMRTLPFTTDQIATSISRYITCAFFGCVEEESYLAGIEIESAGIRGKGYCDKSKIRNAIRKDFYVFIKPERFDDSNELDFEVLLRASRYVNSSYVFENFIQLFVEDIIPTVAVIAVEGLTINLNPFRVNFIGPS